MDARVLVPGRHQPVRRQRDRIGATDHEAEVTRRRARGCSLRRLRCKQVEYRASVLALSRQRGTQGRHHFVAAMARTDVSMRQVLQVVGRKRMGLVEALRELSGVEAGYVVLRASQEGSPGVRSAD